MCQIKETTQKAVINIARMITYHYHSVLPADVDNDRAII